MISQNNSGSQWSKWDLHIHSNASDGKGTPQDIINKAVEKGLSVIAITDHHTVKNLDELKRLGKENNIAVISGIEFRTEYGAKSVHMIGLFPDNCNGIELDQSALEQLILNKLNLSEVIIKVKGREKNPCISDEKAFKVGMFEVQVDFKTTADLIHQYGGLVSVHAGDKASSIEEMKHNGKSDKNVKDVVDSLGTLKDELMREYIDICELGGIGDKNAQFYLCAHNKPSIVASDAHELNDVGRLFTWIKADKTFEGLRQIVYEPAERVHIQETIPEAKSDYQVIESLEIDHSDFGKQIIPFNANMNAIIGGRSSGKSILLGSIAKLSNYEGDVKSNNEFYNSYISEITPCMKLRWRDDSDTENRKVEYFPQSYINSLASNSDDIINLIEGILKGDEIKRTKFEKYNGEISKNKIDISNEIELFFKLTYKINEVKLEIENIGDKKGISSEITKLEIELSDIKKRALVQLSKQDEENYVKLKEEKATLESLIKDVSLIMEQLKNIESISIIRNVESELIGLPDNLKLNLLTEFNELSIEFRDKWKNAIGKKKVEMEKSIFEGKFRIQEIINDKWYCKGEEYYKENATYTELNNRLELEKTKMDKIQKLDKENNELSTELRKICIKIIDLQKKYFSLGENLCEDILLEKEDVRILPYTKFEEEKFKMSIENNMNRRGSAVLELLTYKHKNLDSFEAVLEAIFYGLLEGKYTLKGSKELKQVILEIFSNNYCKIWYDVEYQGDTLSSMSEGKKAFIVLRMLLDFNENVCPILIDQPEDDLDNRAIYSDLVTYIRKKKKERQIIVVTHNPNVVVGADSEEIIIANQHGIQNVNQDGVKFEYLTGSLEHTVKFDKLKPILIGQGVREHVCDILEGGDIAFKKRESKYGL